ncbi:unnamed protein product, partial [Laminaria digitata]
GPYTCIRTVGHRSVAMLPFHLTRLWDSACATGLGAAVKLEGRQSLDQRTTGAIANAVEAFFVANGDADGGCPECMATVLYTPCLSDREDETTTLPTSQPPPSTPPTSQPSAAAAAEVAAETGRVADDSNVIILAHAWPLPLPAAAPGGPMLLPGLEVLVAGVGRSLPEAKHSSWLRDRRPLDDLKAR